MKIQNRYNNQVIYETEALSIKEAVEKAIKNKVNLSKADLDKIVSTRIILPEGEIIGFKKLSNNTICKLKIPNNARRVGGVTSRKCRAEFAMVLEGEGESKWEETKVNYRTGEMVYPDKFDPDPLIECSNGIHFFITEEEAKQY